MAKGAAEASIRLRILKDLQAIGRQHQRRGGRGFDPTEDTERSLIRLATWRSRSAAEASIRLRILKDDEDDQAIAVIRRGRGFDPTEDTERTDLRKHRCAQIMRQRLRSD